MAPTLVSAGCPQEVFPLVQLRLSNVTEFFPSCGKVTECDLFTSERAWEPPRANVSRHSLSEVCCCRQRSTLRSTPDLWSLRNDPGAGGEFPLISVQVFWKWWTKHRGYWTAPTGLLQAVRGHWVIKRNEESWTKSFSEKKCCLTVLIIG